jgi:ceramide glucosyltransferase
MAVAMTILSAIGVLITSLQSILAAIFRRRSGFFGGGLRSQAVAAPFFRPVVSILKPLCGLEDDLEGNLESFARLTGGGYEVVV